MRNYKRRGNQTRPEKAGPQNFPEEIRQKYKVTTTKERIELAGNVELIKKSFEERAKRKGNWTREELKKSVVEYFQFMNEYGMKPCKANARLWFGVSSTTYNDWERNKGGKYGEISDVIKALNDILESYYVNGLDKHPTGNIFLLKTSHGHVESSKLDITSDGKELSNADDVRKAVANLNLKQISGEQDT